MCLQVASALYGLLSPWRPERESDVEAYAFYRQKHRFMSTVKIKVSNDPQWGPRGPPDPDPTSARSHGNPGHPIGPAELSQRGKPDSQLGVRRMQQLFEMCVLVGRTLKENL